MYNPANIDSPAFSIELFLASWAKRKTLSKKEKIFFMRKMDNLKKSTLDKKNIFGENKDEYANYIDQSFWKNFQKKKEATKKKDIIFFNDLKNLSFVLIYTLLNRQNTIFVTADHDLIAYLFTWVESVSQEMVFK